MQFPLSHLVRVRTRTMFEFGSSWFRVEGLEFRVQEFRSRVGGS